MQYELFFRNPVFHNGLNATVRKGEKWMNVAIGDSLLIKESEKESVISTGVVIGKLLLPFELIPESLLQYEHDPSCRNPSGLFAELKRVYSDISQNDLVTVILFTI